MQELLYTSAPRGLKPGSRGFCTVLSTQGMVAPLAAALEGLSAYRPVYPTGHPQVAQNPVVYSHVKLQVAGKSWHVLSRIADYGLDYSQRTNKIAHHLVLDRSELPGAGPASVLRLPDLMRTAWEGEPQLVPPRTLSRQPAAPAGVCKTWKALTGDAGWAGVVAESFLKDSTRPVILLFEPGQDVAALFDEALSLLPPDKRWEVTFSSYFTGASQGVTCLWRGIVKGSREATESLRFVNALRIELGTTDLGRAEGGELVDEARSGTRKLQLRPAPQTPPRATRPAPDATESPENRQPDPKPYSLQAPDPAGPPPVSSEIPGTAPPVLTKSIYKFAQESGTRLTSRPEKSSSTTKWILATLLLLLLGVSGFAIWHFTLRDFTISSLSNTPKDAAPSQPTKTRNDGRRTAQNTDHNGRPKAGADSQPRKEKDKSTDEGRPDQKPGTAIDANNNKNTATIPADAKVAEPANQPPATSPPAPARPTVLYLTSRLTDKKDLLSISTDVICDEEPVALSLVNPQIEKPQLHSRLDRDSLIIFTNIKILSNEERQDLIKCTHTKDGTLTLTKTAGFPIESHLSELSLCAIAVKAERQSKNLLLVLHKPPKQSLTSDSTSSEPIDEMWLRLAPVLTMANGRISVAHKGKRFHFQSLPAQQISHAGCMPLNIDFKFSEKKEENSPSGKAKIAGKIQVINPSVATLAEQANTQKMSALDPSVEDVCNELTELQKKTNDQDMKAKIGEFIRNLRDTDKQRGDEEIFDIVGSNAVFFKGSTVSAKLDKCRENLREYRKLFQCEEWANAIEGGRIVGGTLQYAIITGDDRVMVDLIHFEPPTK